MAEREALGRPPGDPAVILPVLAEHDVEFLVIGGLAVIAHGYPRLTQDVDILPSPDAANMRRLGAALRELDAHATDDHARKLPLPLDHPEGLALGNYFLTTKGGALDLVNGPRPDVKRYKDLASRAVEFEFAGTRVKVMGRADLIANKEAAGREKDLADIAALTEAERRRPELAGESSD